MAQPTCKIWRDFHVDDRRILTGDFQFKAALSVLKFARALELSTDRLAAFGHLFREHLLADLSA